MTPDPYEVLDVALDADIDLIKAKYRQLVRENHPDINPDKTAANARMVDILEAWRTLSDPERRSRLDTNKRLAEEKARQAAAGARPPGMPSGQGRTTGSGARPSPPSRGPRAKQGTGPRSSGPRARLLAQVNQAAALYFREGKADEAINLCQRCLKTDSRNLEATLLLGDIFASQGDKEKALIMFERVLLLQPNNMLVRRKRDALLPKAPEGSPPAWAQPVAREEPAAPPPPKASFLGRIKARLGSR